MGVLTHGSLFAGIEGFGEGFRRTGKIETVWAVEIEEYPRELLKLRFPELELFGDVRKVGKYNLRAVDIISAGIPCPPFSVAGKRGGKEDSRYLWPETVRVIKEVRPTWFVFENVFGLESMGFPISDLEVVSRSITSYADEDHYEGIYTLQERMYLDYFCEQLEEIGYDVQTFNIPAIALGGSHIRKRVWIVAHAN